MLRTSSGNGERTLDGAQLLVGNERWVGRVANVDLSGLEETADVLATEAVADSSNLLNTEGLAHVLDALLDNRVHMASLVVGKPSGKISLAGFHVAHGDLVTLEQIRDNGQVAIVGELVGQKLGVGEDAEDIGQEEDGLVGALIFRVGDVGLDCRSRTFS